MLSWSIINAIDFFESYFNSIINKHLGIIKTYPNKTAKNSIMYWRFRPVSNIPSLNILKQAEEYCVTSFIVKGFLLTSKLNQKFGNGFKLKVLSFTISNLASQHCSQRGFFFFLSGFSFTNIHYSQDSRGRRRVST